MRASRILAIVLILVGLIGVFVGGRELYSRLLYVGLLWVVISWIWSRFAMAGVGLSRRARSLRASMGDIFEEHFEVKNESRLPKLWLEIANETSMPNASGSRLLTMISARQTRTYISRTWLTQRGGFPLGPTRITSGDPFGLFRMQQIIPESDTLVVLPMIYPIESFISPPGMLTGGQVIRRKAIDITPHAAGVREYVHGDPMKLIHWPLTARQGKLIVKEFEQDPQAEVWLFFDTQDTVHVEIPYELPVEKAENWMFRERPEFELPPSTLEYGVSIAASLTHYFISQQRSVGMISASRSFNIIPAERSERQENKILETLAFLKANSRFSLPGLVTAQAGQLPQGSSAVLITPTVLPELMIAIDDLQRRNIRPIVILLIAESFGGSMGSDELYKTLLENNVPVCQIFRGANLSVELSGFSAQIRRGGDEWQRPVLSHLI